MRRFAIGLALAAGVANAVEVTVVDPGAKPVALGTARCLEPPSNDSVPVVQGRASVPAECKSVRCDASGFLSGEVKLGSGPAQCALAPALSIAVELSAEAAATGLEARLFAFGRGSSPVAAIGVPKAAAGKSVSRATFPAVKPARYALEIVHLEDKWTCRADLGPLAAGPRVVTPAWRAPSKLQVRVKNAEGKPAPGIPVRVLGPRPLEEDAAPRWTTLGVWTCAMGAGEALLTDPAGAVTLAVDLDRPTMIAAGELKVGRGFAFAALDRMPAQPYSMTLAPPVSVQAKVVSEKDVPLPCAASLDELPAEAVWAMRSLGSGANMKATCDREGRIALGPFPSSPFAVSVVPRPGLPLRVTSEAPAPGTSADLGTLRVKNGESFRVVVVDEKALPITKAKVTVRAASGVLLVVEALTGDDGVADVSGLPRNASVSFDVKATGYLSVKRSGLELDASPTTVSLTRGGKVDGRVVDADGAPVDAAGVGLWGDGVQGPDPVNSDASGRFTFDGVEDGKWRLTAAANGFRPAAPIPLEIIEHGTVDDVTIVLEAANGIAGRVVDPAGAPVAGAQVRLYLSGSAREVDRSPPLASATSDADGSFRLQGTRSPNGWLVASKPGYGPCAVRPPDAAKGDDVTLALTDPATLLVHLPRAGKSAEGVSVIDGAGTRRVSLPSPAIDVAFTDLAPGRGGAALGNGVEKPVALRGNETVEITLDPGAAVEGRVTFEGAPTPRAYVHAVRALEGGGQTGSGGGFTDERGRYRIDGIAPGAYRLVAVGEDGRGEAAVELAEGESGHVDFALRSVRLVLTVVDAADGKPMPGMIANATPAGGVCNSVMSSSSWTDPGELGYDITVGASGCVSTQTDAAGIARIGVAAPGSYTLVIGTPGFNAYNQPIALVEGTTTKRVALTRKPEQKAEKPRVVANLLTDPPGLAGRVEWRSGNHTSSSAPVTTRFQCGEVEPGHVEVSFHVEGYGRGRAVVNVPNEPGEYEVDVNVKRGGTIVVPVTQVSTAPALVDASGFAWANAQGNGRIPPALEDLPTGGRVWIYRDVPPGTYTVTIGENTRPSVVVIPGATAFAN